MTTSASEAPPLSIITWPGSLRSSICEFCVTTVCPPENGAGWLTAFSVLMTIDRLPCETAQLSSVTAWFITTEPVRALRITLAAVCAGVRLMLSRAPRKATRWLLSAGARTRITRPSWAAAVPVPKCRLTASTTLLAVEKSVSFNSRYTESPCPNAVGTARSTVAPEEMRPTLRWFTWVLLPPAEAPAPPTTTFPCAMP